ncbi:iron-hydroxamate ABC transporter substrate-binding protein [Paenibacillus paeoniae]|uniref:ABC transporter substrate-binding protein n=1 Tax=Paenibacillus paeoniae TaxID=2292705 RepID=A0A371PHC9_9BACL|nr:iron-hydroxamate ABC transporter substrate-binding protein [Paenibacillus paeoniae]REK75636.1 ABC transporter substrate-binding protein [Paenibacillus paeoniae]
MKKALAIPFILLLVLIVSACGSNTVNNQSPSPSPSESTAPEGGNSSGDTITYQSELGPVEVPANPQRIVALSSAPNLLSLGVKLVGVDEWTYGNPLFKEMLTDTAVVSETSLEKILELEPDLILAGAHINNIAKLQEIAPTVVYTWGKNDYLTQQLEVGKLVNKEKEAQAWIDDFTVRAEALGQKVKEKIGENATVSVLEVGDNKTFYTFGNNFARGTELLYQAMKLNMPEKVKEDALGPGLFALSTEVVSEYAGDYIILSRRSQVDVSFMELETWKNIPAVANGHVIEINTDASSYSDPTTLENLFKIFEEGFMK